jgi:hypothetical protein
MTIPKRTRGEVIAVDPGAGTLTIRTDAAGRLPSRQVVLTAQEAAGQSPDSPVRLSHGYAMTVAIAQARGWTDSYVVLTASQLTGLEQTYTAQTRATRCTRLYGGADRILGGDVPEDSLQLRDQVKDTLAESLVRPTRKVTTLDYLDPGERSLLEERFAAPRQSPPHFDALASPAQLEMAERLRRPVPGDATWLEASAAVDVARGHAPGTQAVAWLGQIGIPASDAWRRVASALDDQSAGAPLPRKPVRARGARAFTEPDPHLAAIEELLSAPPEKRLDAAERYRHQRVAAAPAGPTPETASASHAASRPRPGTETPIAEVRKKVVERPPDQQPDRPRPQDAPIWKGNQPKGVRAPKRTDDGEQRRRDQLTRESAEQARRQAGRERGPREGQ